MRRESRTPRSDYEQKVERLGLVFHTVEGKPYWNEEAAYRFEQREIAELEAAANDLHELCLKAVEHVIHGKLYARLNIPKRAWPVIERAWQSHRPSFYGRFDLSYGGEEPPKLLEYNADTPTSLLEAAVIQWHWLQEAEPESDQFNSIWDGLVERWGVLKLSEGVHFGCVGIPEDLMTTAVMMDTAMEAGVKAILIPMGQIGWSHHEECFVDESQLPIRTLFKLYPWEWLLADDFGPRALKTYDQIQWIEPIWKMILSNKAILAVLWQLFPDHPNLLPAYLDGPRDLTSYVRKPFLGREGANVTIVGPDLTVEVEGPYAGPYVYQQYAPLPVFEGNHAVVGAWVIGDRARGIGVRESDGPITEDLARFVPHYFSNPRRSAVISSESMNVQIIRTPPIHVVMLRHIGPYEQIGPVFDSLWGWIEANQIPAQRNIGIYWDNPDYTPAPRLRSAACAEIPQGYPLPDRQGLALEVSDLVGGEYATTTYIGPYENMAPVWTQFTQYVEGPLRRRIGSNPAFEVYVNDPDTTPAQQLVTELYMPVL